MPATKDGRVPDEIAMRARLGHMLFMVIERFRHDDPGPVGERFRRRGRMLPDGVSYLTSWMEATGARCFQVMEAESRELLQPWIDCWSDLVELEIVPVLTSAEFWADAPSAPG